MTTPVATPDATEHRAGAAREKFRSAALDLFVEHGFNGTTLQMIGDRLEVSKAAVNYHFRSKDELLTAVLDPAFAALEAMLDSAETVRRDSARRRQGLAAYIDYLITHRRVVAWLSRDVAAVSHPGVLPRAYAINQRVNQLFTATSEDPVARVWSAAIVQALSGPMQAEVALTDDELRTELEHIGDTLIRGYLAAARRVGSHPG